MMRVVVTGVGIVSPVGSGRELFWRNLCAGRSGIGPITIFDASCFPVHIGGEVKDLDMARLASLFPEAVGQRDRKTWLGLAAAAEAIADGGVPAASLRDATLHVGVGLEAFFLEDLTRAAAAGDLARGLALAAVEQRGRPVQTPLDYLADVIGNHWGMTGPRMTNCSACAAGTQAIGEAMRMIQDGRADVAIAGAADSMLNPLGMGGFSLLRVLSTENDHPGRACRPFDATREGTVLGEGAAFLVLESVEHAARRWADVYAEMLGYGSSMDAYRLSDPDPTAGGAVLAMARAIRDSGLGPGEIDCVNAHGTGTPKNDAVETAAIKHVLGSRAREIPVHAVKSMTGHLIGASGAVEAVAAALTLARGVVPPTINLTRRDPQCDLDYVAEGCRGWSGRTVLSNSFAFGGQNATLVMGRWNERRKGSEVQAKSGGRFNS